MGAELLRRVVRIGAAGMLTMAAGPSLALLDAVPAGEWALREIGGSAPARLVCVRNPQLLIQIQHGAAACRRFVVSGGPRSATIEYSCAGQGHGRTLITVERRCGSRRRGCGRARHSTWIMKRVTAEPATGREVRKVRSC